MVRPINSYLQFLISQSFALLSLSLSLHKYDYHSNCISYSKIVIRVSFNHTQNITQNMRIPRIVYSHMKIANDNYNEYKTKIHTHRAKKRALSFLNCKNSLIHSLSHSRSIFHLLYERSSGVLTSTKSRLKDF